MSSLYVEEVLRPYQNEILNLKEFDHRSLNLPEVYLVGQNNQQNNQQYQI